ncbi:5-taurinomethyluridine-[tRNA] synthase subunit GTPB3, mitochondrial-like [Clavelina lepadiformis]|uniref:5-taurinomethyluridine-[tRNA] synthase subunit GTPB3, mitochondrial-like n=1 Tax=Clavelina lepadiformis TaxID=159417 RepID=UPI00404304D3
MKTLNFLSKRFLEQCKTVCVNRIVVDYQRFGFHDFKQNDTIFALSSGFGKCGVAVIRVSGDHTKQVIKEITGCKNLPKPRQAFVSKLRHPKTQVMLDRALVMWFSAPNSFTGEDICEFQVHGGPAVIASVLNALSSIKGLRPAAAGDYTKRAFLNNKLDLTEVEGLGDLIHAETEAQRRQALHQMEGSLSVLYKQWSKDLLKCTAHVEAYIDFSEDQGLHNDLLGNVKNEVKELLQKIRKHLLDKHRGEILRSGVRVAIVGEPNVGKSSLLNAIIQRPAAIVSPIAGTTRDVIETSLDIEGYPVLISDTAGLRDSSNAIEQEGIIRAHKKAEQADLVIFMVDGQNLKNDVNLEEFLVQHAFKLGIELSIRAENVVVIVNKTDLISSGLLSELESFKRFPIILLSCETFDGFSGFMNFFTKMVQSLCGVTALGEIPSVTQQRHRDHLTSCIEYLESSLNITEQDIVIAAEYLRMALNEIGKISGKVGAEEILDVIFKDFCIGK